MAAEMDMQTMDDGSVYMVSKGFNRFTLSVRGSNGGEGEVTLLPDDLLMIVATGIQLIREDQPIEPETWVTPWGCVHPRGQGTCDRCDGSTVPALARPKRTSDEEGPDEES